MECLRAFYHVGFFVVVTLGDATRVIYKGFRNDSAAAFQRDLDADGLRRAHRDILYEAFHMKRSVVFSMVLSFVTVVAVGCDKKTTMERIETVTTPDGSTMTTDTHKIESSGDNAPTNTNGEKAD